MIQYALFFHRYIKYIPHTHIHTFFLIVFLFFTLFSPIDGFGLKFGLETGRWETGEGGRAILVCLEICPSFSHRVQNYKFCIIVLSLNLFICYMVISSLIVCFPSIINFDDN